MEEQRGAPEEGALHKPAFVQAAANKGAPEIKIRDKLANSTIRNADNLLAAVIIASPITEPLAPHFRFASRYPRQRRNVYFASYDVRESADETKGDDQVEYGHEQHPDQDK